MLIAKCHDAPRCLCLCDVSTVEVRADPAEGRKSALLEFRTFLSDKGTCSWRGCDGAEGTTLRISRFLCSMERAAPATGERRKETRENGKEERKGHSFKVPQPL